MRKRILDLFYKTKYGLVYTMAVGAIFGIIIATCFHYGGIVERILTISLWISWVIYTSPFIKYD